MLLILRPLPAPRCCLPRISRGSERYRPGFGDDDGFLLPLLTLDVAMLLRTLPLPLPLRLLPLLLPTQLGIETSGTSPDNVSRTAPPDRLLLTGDFRLIGGVLPGRLGSNGGGAREPERVALLAIPLPGNVPAPLSRLLPASSEATVAAGAAFSMSSIFLDNVVGGTPRVPTPSSSFPWLGEDDRAALWGGGGKVKGAAAAVAAVAAVAAAAATAAPVETPRRSSSDCSRYDGWLRSSLMRCFFAFRRKAGIGKGGDWERDGMGGGTVSKLRKLLVVAVPRP